MIIDTNNMLEVVGLFFAVGVPTTSAAFLIFKWFVQKWLEQKFAERLANLKAEQDAALRHIQSSIDHQIHRAKKLYDTEFEVMTKAWSLLEELYGHVVDTTLSAPLYAEWDCATPSEIRAILNAETNFTNEQKIQILEADNPADEFRAVYDFQRVKVYEAAGMEFSHLLGSRGIFMPREIRDKFKRLSVLMSLTFSEFASNIRRENAARRHFMALNTEGNILRDELRDLIERRLWSAAETQEPKR